MPAVGSEHCPHCDAEVVIDTRFPFGSAACDACGRPLWYLTINDSLAFFRYSDAAFVWELFAAIPEHQHISPELGCDDFDLLELVADFRTALAKAG